jgi:hypothetical protein
MPLSVIAGLDPAIQGPQRLDARIKSEHARERRQPDGLQP